jgi:hypothetical protein
MDGALKYPKLMLQSEPNNHYPVSQDFNVLVYQAIID